MTVRIVTDSACDLRGDEVDALGIEVVPLSIRFGNDEFVDREELSVEEFYRRLVESDTLPETSAPSPGRFAEAFQRQFDSGASAVVCLDLSAALSATMQSAVTAADSFDGRVHVIDSASITAGLGTMAIEAARLGVDGAGVDDVIALIEDMKPRTRVFGALDTLDNLKKGGRIGGAQAMIGSMLSIKPLLDLSSGEVVEAGRQRTRRKALAWLRDTIKSHGEIEHLSVMHGEAPDIDDFLAMVGEFTDLAQVRVEKIGPVIGTHGGPRVMGCAFQVPH